MVYSEALVEQVISYLPDQILLEEKKMMGGLILMVNEKMFIGIDKDRNTQDDRLMVRVGKENYDKALGMKGARRMDFTGREMKGFVFVYPEGFTESDEINKWILLALDYNKIAPKSKKKNK